VERSGIKGSLFAAVVDDLNQLIATGAVGVTEVEAQLDAKELELLDAKINTAGWYDIHTYHRMVGILCSAEGGDSREYWLERGRRAARRMADSGIYQQFDYLGRTKASAAHDAESRFRAFGKDVRLLLSLQAAVLSFGEWKTVVDPDHDDRYRVEIRGIRGIPDGIFLAATGTFNEMSALASPQRPHRWEYERAEPDLAFIRMTDPA